MTAAVGASGVVLAGAAALGAYEAGVLAYLVEDVARDVRVMPTVLSGTSAGALNAMALAAFADEPAHGMRSLVRAWTELRLGQFLRPSSIELLSMFFDLAGVPLRLRRALHVRSIRGGLLDQAPIAALVARIPFARIADHLASGRLHGVAVSATRVASGAAVTFHQAAKLARAWHAEVNLVPIATQITADHVLASAAIPLLFPTVEVDSDRYCDGGLRQMVPLSPAIHLGADRLLVVNPLPAVPAGASSDARSTPTTSPLYLVGKALNALFADRVETDLARLLRTTSLLRAGARRFGPSFEREINLELARAGEPELHAIDALCIEPSQDLGALAAEHVTSPGFASRVPGGAGRLLRCIADGDPTRVRDLLAYLLFDGSFTAVLVELGRADARARHDDLCALLEPRTAEGMAGSARRGPALASSRYMTETRAPTWDEVRRIADELKLQIHLASMDVRDRWNELQPRLAEVEQTIAREGERAGKAVAAQIASLGTTLRELRDELKDKLDAKRSDR